MINPVARAYLECVANLSKRYENANAKYGHLKSIAVNLPSEKLSQGREVMSALDAQMQMSFTDYDVALPLLRRARVFDLSQEVYLAAKKRVFKGDLIGVPDLEALPFDVCWFGCEGKDVLDVLCDDELEEKRADAPIVLTRGGMFLTPAPIDGQWVLVASKALDEDGWDALSLSTVWVCALLAEVAKTHAVKSKPMELSVRRLMDKAGKHRPLPPELYTVRMNARQAGRAVSAVVTAHARLSYRFEVAGHPRLLVRRGRWPDPERCQSWAEHGYEVFHGTAVPESWRIAMDLRAVPPPTEKEWIALKLVQVSTHEKGPEGPVIRATRTG